MRKRTNVRNFMPESVVSWSNDMSLLFVVTVSCLILGSFELEVQKVCYGESLDFPSDIAPAIFGGRIYFTPKDGGPTKVLMDKGEAKDPRFQSYPTKFSLKDLTEKDKGTFSVTFNTDNRLDIIELDVLDCAISARRLYQENFYLDVPLGAEYLEFTPTISEAQTKVLWNRTNPEISEGGRGEMKGQSWQIIKVTQTDAGFYNVRGKDKLLLSRTLLRVDADVVSYDKADDQDITLTFPWTDVSSWSVTVKLDGEEDYFTLIKDGTLLSDNSTQLAYKQFHGRIQLLHDGIRIKPLRISDSAIYEFRDEENNPAQIVYLNVSYESPPYLLFLYVGVGMTFVGILCCWLVKRCCCKNGCHKRHQASSRTAAPPAASPAASNVYYHNQNNLADKSNSAANTTSYSYQPMNPSVPKDRAASSSGSPKYSPVNVHVNPQKPEAAPVGDTANAPAPTFSSNGLSSDPEPRFEVIGLTIPSAVPLSSDSTSSDVYSSDKLNSL